MTPNPQIPAGEDCMLGDTSTEKPTGKHTPGPWHAFNHSWCETSVLADGFDHAICLLDINHATEESQEADEALMAANARLIAAAPELLVGLQAAANYIDKLGGDSKSYRALITKATGVQA